MWVKKSGNPLPNLNRQMTCAEQRRHGSDQAKNEFHFSVTSFRVGVGRKSANRGRERSATYVGTAGVR
jgi:hypothetical protein